MATTDHWVDLPETTFLMGNETDAYPSDGEGPVRLIQLSPFSISATAVTTAEFASFVHATGYQTTAECEGWSFVFAGHLPDNFGETRGVVGAEWWRQVLGATWSHPEGPQSNLVDRDHHPVVHVSWFDATAYAEWAGGRIPTEAEWECAARGGLEGRRLPWGDDNQPDGPDTYRFNIFTGMFWSEDDAADGWAGTCPVDAFEPNAYGLYNCSGNVWEWTADWFTTHHQPDGVTIDPVGPQIGVNRVLKGGSFLCHDSYCHRYRLAARSSSTPDSTTSHQGFRIAYSTPQVG
ncbi:MAG: formylglycine-generating enzyme family protein [Acidimicrobiales bacterium]|nr:formylglycine-generating enzyme family protein [Acidimicrobiales bacterium]